MVAELRLVVLEEVFEPINTDDIAAPAQAAVDAAAVDADVHPAVFQRPARSSFFSCPWYCRMKTATTAPSAVSSSPCSMQLHRGVVALERQVQGDGGARR